MLTGECNEAKGKVSEEVMYHSRMSLQRRQRLYGMFNERGCPLPDGQSVACTYVRRCKQTESHSLGLERRIREYEARTADLERGAKEGEIRAADAEGRGKLVEVGSRHGPHDSDSWHL